MKFFKEEFNLIQVIKISFGIYFAIMVWLIYAKI